MYLENIAQHYVREQASQEDCMHFLHNMLYNCKIIPLIYF